MTRTENISGPHPNSQLKERVPRFIALDGRAASPVHSFPSLPAANVSTRGPLHQSASVRILVTLVTSYVTLNNLLKLSVPQFLHCKMKMIV